MDPSYLTAKAGYTVDMPHHHYPCYYNNKGNGHNYYYCGFYYDHKVCILLPDLLSVFMGLAKEIQQEDIHK